MAIGLPDPPSLPELPDLPEMPQAPRLPQLPQLPSFGGSTRRSPYDKSKRFGADSPYLAESIYKFPLGINN